MDGVHYAVLIGIHQDGIILTKRAHTLRTFPGHICLPGGKFDKTDTDLTATAVREFYEEVNFAGTVSPFFCLNPEFSPTAKENLYPIVARLKGEVNSFNPDEVSKILCLNLADLNHTLFRVNSELPHIRHNWCFDYAGEYVWGVTASILKNLCFYKEQILCKEINI